MLWRGTLTQNTLHPPCRLQAVADDLADIVPRDRGSLAVPTDITSSEDVGALAERCAYPHTLDAALHKSDWNPN